MRSGRQAGDKYSQQWIVYLETIATMLERQPKMLLVTMDISVLNENLFPFPMPNVKLAFDQ